MVKVDEYTKSPKNPEEIKCVNEAAIAMIML
jgi:hypothetical protein